MNKKVLLLNQTNEVLNFISDKKALKLFIKGKVDIVSVWKDVIYYSLGYLFLPAILRLKYYVKKRYTQLIFSRRAILKRDRYLCQYCHILLQPEKATIDHIIPRCMGGASSFTNCVASCYPCNSKKGNKTLEQVGMKLLTKPIMPSGLLFHTPENHWHQDWNTYLNAV